MKFDRLAKGSYIPSIVDRNGLARISGNEVRLGIDAPTDVRIMRTEILERDRERADKKTG